MNELLISIIGSVIVFRKIRSDTFISYFPKLQISFFIITIVLSIISTYYIGIFFISLIIISKILKKTIEKKLEDRILCHIDRIILSQKSGKSFRQSIQLIQTNVQNNFEKDKLLNLLKALSDDETNENDVHIFCPSLFHFFSTELVAISKQKTQQLEQLQLLRRQIKIILQLRHKSGQASQQAKAQGVIISLLFIAMSFFMSKTFGWSNVIPFIQVSIPLFFIGLLLIWKISRSFKWSL